MRNRMSLLALGALVLSVPMSAAVLKSGRWEITIKTVQPTETPAMTSEVCISKAEAEHPEPPKNKSIDDCITTGALQGNVLKYKTKCGKRKVSTDAEFTYSSDHYEGVVTMEVDGGTIRQLYSAKRIGDCDESAAPVTPPPPPQPQVPAPGQ